jgi:serine/threonine protein kinase
MELMDGDLNKLGNELIKNPDNLDDYTYDMVWASMIFQICYGIYYLNSLGILHNDAKPKNVLYEKKSGNDYLKYSINGKKYNVPTYYLFKIADFGAIQIIGSSLNKMNDDEIKDKINNKYDYYELSKLINRILVNYAIKVYSIASLDKLFHNDNDYIKYKKEEISKVEENTYLRNIPNKQQFILRGLLYYLIETKKLDLTETISKNNIKLPSKKIMTIFDNITNLKIDFFDLFNDIF